MNRGRRASGFCRNTVTPDAAFIVVLVAPRIKIGLQSVDRIVDLLAEGDMIEPAEHGLVQSLDDLVGLAFMRV